MSKYDRDPITALVIAFLVLLSAIVLALVGYGSWQELIK